MRYDNIRPASPANRRTRDMTRKEFHTALHRHGWRQVLMWVEGTKNDQTVSVGMVMIDKGRGYKLNRRASLAKAIRELDSRS